MESREGDRQKKWGLFDWILLVSIVLMAGVAIADFVFDFPITFIPIIFVFPLFGGIFRKRKN